MPRQKNSPRHPRGRFSLHHPGDDFTNPWRRFPELGLMRLRLDFTRKSSLLYVESPEAEGMHQNADNFVSRDRRSNPAKRTDARTAHDR
jgi:hypothetical protein